MNTRWWKETVVYQIYPRSFKDSNGDGIGDLRGIIEKLDYLKDLGIGAVWLNPVYQSPNDDMGYDISDYQAIMTEFGTLEDFDELLEGLHARGIRLIMDLVVNHTSDEHAWFIESRSSKDNPKRDYYIWRPGKDGKEPNNWASFFSPSAWEYDEKTGEYYLHLFSKKQPDLNWKNDKVKEEVFSMMNWWLDRGVDGFRMDVINLVCKADGLPDSNKPVGLGGYSFADEYFANQPGIHELLQEMNQKVFEGRDSVTIGETCFVTPEIGGMYVDESRKELNMIFQFELMDVDSGPSGKWEIVPWKLSKFKSIITRWQTELSGIGWNSLYWSNHDQPRPVSRFGDDGKYRVESAKMLATVLHMLQGTPFIYQGEELGMTNVPFHSPDELRDLESFNLIEESLKAGKALEEVMTLIHKKGRDNARTPMQWEASKEAGFTSGTPWIKVNPNYKEINVKESLENPESIYYYYKRLIELRRDNPVMVYGQYVPLLEEHEEVMAYLRVYGDTRWLVVANFYGGNVQVELPEEYSVKNRSIIICNKEASRNEDRIVSLTPYEARVYKLN